MDITIFFVSYIIIIGVSWIAGKRRMLKDMRSCCGNYQPNGSIKNCSLSKCPVLNGS